MLTLPSPQPIVGKFFSVNGVEEILLEVVL